MFVIVFVIVLFMLVLIVLVAYVTLCLSLLLTWCMLYLRLIVGFMLLDVWIGYDVWWILDCGLFGSVWVYVSCFAGG